MMTEKNSTVYIQWTKLHDRQVRAFDQHLHIDRIEVYKKNAF